MARQWGGNRMEFLIAAAISISISIVTSFLMPNKTQKVKPQTFNDDSFPQIDENTPKYIVSGQGKIPDWQVEWSGNYRTTAVKTKGGGKK